MRRATHRSSALISPTCMLVLATAGCGDAGSGDIASNDSADVDATSQGGDASTTCPLDATARQHVEAIVRAAIADGGWIVGNTHGSGAFAGRAFGAAVPLSDVAVLLSATLMSACTEANLFDPYCQSPEPGQAPAVTRCSRLDCKGAGIVLAHAWIDALPVTLATTTAEGDMVVSRFDAQTLTTELPDDVLELAWDNQLTLQLAAGGLVEVRTEGSDRLAGELHATVLDVTVTTAASTLLVHVTSDGDGPIGSGVMAGDTLVTLQGDTFAWSSACQAP